MYTEDGKTPLTSPCACVCISTDTNSMCVDICSGLLVKFKNVIVGHQRHLLLSYSIVALSSFRSFFLVHRSPAMHCNQFIDMVGRIDGARMRRWLLIVSSRVGVLYKCSYARSYITLILLYVQHIRHCRDRRSVYIYRTVYMTQHNIKKPSKQQCEQNSTTT